MSDSNEAIVLNRMYAGSYLSTHLGHEVINMFQADNGKHYLYLNSNGVFDHKGFIAKDMLLVMHVGGKRVKVLGLAKNLRPAICEDSSRSSGYKDVCSSDSDRRHSYRNTVDCEITYGGVSILDIFGNVDQPDVFVSYEVDENDFFEPINEMIICFDEREAQSGDYVMREHNFASTSLRRFILSGNEDYDTLYNLISYSSLWRQRNEKVEVGSYKSHELSLFDICRIRNNENCFSDALAYFMEKYPDLWVGFFKELGITLSDNFTVAREADAKVKSDKCKENTGGRIDLLLSDEKTFIVIENKIKSNINKVEADIEVEQDQLDRYKNYIKYIIDNKNVEQAAYQLFVLAPDYSKLNIKSGTDYKIIRYSCICNYLADKIVAIADDDFTAFYFAMRRHSFNPESLCLYDDMKNIFYRRIEALSNKQSK